MLGTFLLVLSGFALLVLRSYRQARARERAGQAFQPQGKLRW
jgi:hypothetical protein